MRINLTASLIFTLLLTTYAKNEPLSLLSYTPAQSQSSAPYVAPKPSSKDRVMRTSAYAGDTGARINTASAALKGAGWIIVDTPGEIKTPVHLAPNQTLKFMAGNYPTVVGNKEDAVILLEDGDRVFGEGTGKTTLLEPINGYVVIRSAGVLEREQGHGAVGIRSNLEVAGFTLEGTNQTAEGGARSIVELGNAHHAYVHDLKLHNTTALGVTVGATGLTGKHAEDWIVERCIFQGVASQNLNVVNGTRVTFRHNQFIGAGKLCAQKPCEGVTPIDLEPNTHADLISYITIEDNVIDSSTSPFPHGNGILVQNTVGIPPETYGPVVVRRNKVSGGPLKENFSGNVYTGIYLTSATHTTVSDNDVQRCAHAGIRLEGGGGNVIERNRVVSAGTGGIGSFEILGSSNNRIAFNTVTVDPRSPLGLGLISESANSSNNVYEGNVATPNGLALEGKGSKVIGASR